MAQLICFPHAGGGAGAFRDWMLAPPPGLTVRPVCLPGRDQRIRETAFERMEPLLDWLAAELSGIPMEEAVFFGHSMGGRIAHAFCLLLRDAGMPLPRALAVSACAPRRDPARAQMHRLEKTALLQRLSAYDPGNGVLRDHPELWDLMEPVLRADFTVVETYDPPEAPPLPLPIVALAGAQDPLVAPAALQGWSTLGCGFDYLVFDGGHFYLRDAPQRVLAQLCDALAALGVDLLR